MCKCEVLLFNVKYISSDGRLLREAVRAQFLFINRTNDVLLPADQAISIIDKNVRNSKSTIPKLNALSKANFKFLNFIYFYHISYKLQLN